MLISIDRLSYKNTEFFFLSRKIFFFFSQSENEVYKSHVEEGVESENVVKKTFTNNIINIY